MCQQYLRHLVWTSCLASGLLVVSACSSQKRADRAESDQQASTIADRTASEPNDADEDDEPDGPKRIILMIGDGMGTPAMTAGTYARGRPLRMLSMEQLGFITTHSHEYVTTDSAASATAFATGEKTHYQGVSVEPGTTKQQETNSEHHLKTTLELAESRGWKTGLVSTSRVVHATPAAFASHRASRYAYDGIAADMAQSGVDVLLGGGRKHFVDDRRSDGRDLLGDLDESGYRIADTADEVRAASGVADRVVGLLHDSYLPEVTSDQRAMSLPDMTREAIEILDRNNDDGFFLMVEGSQIDWAEHDVDGPRTVAETRDFDRAVGEALEYARHRDDTLVVTVADHETGGLAVLDPDKVEPHVETLGGQEQAEQLVDYPDSADVAEDVPDAISEVDIEKADGGEGDNLGIGRLEDDVFWPSFGHLSVASRAHRPGPDDFLSTHTPEIIPMWAEGPGARRMTAASDNAEVGRHLKELVREESTATDGTSSESNRDSGAPRNVVLLVGEGAGFDAWTAAYYADGSLNARTLEHRGLVATHGARSLVPDEAASGTALAVGTRTMDGMMGMVPDDDGHASRRTVLERAESRGLNTGLVTDGSLFNPTLAAMYAHGRTDISGGEASAPNQASSRGDRAEAFVELASRLEGADGVDVAYGEAEELDGPLRERLSSQGVTFAEGQPDAAPEGRHLVDVSGDSPTLAARTRAALQHLSSRDRGFFLVVESEDIGEAQQALARDEQLVDEVRAFDEAAGVARDFAQRHDDTLVITTADRDYSLSTLDDHYGFTDGICDAAERCGGETQMTEISVAVDEIEDGDGLSDTTLQGEYAPPTLFLQYTWLIQAADQRGDVRDTPTANFVPLFAEGPWSERLEGFVGQPRIGQLLEKWGRSAGRPE